MNELNKTLLLNKSLFGLDCMIAPQIKKQKKISKYRFVNWLYKKIYGYNYESTIDSDVLVSGNFIIFKDEETFNKLKELTIKS